MKDGHEVVLHARWAERADQARDIGPPPWRSWPAISAASRRRAALPSRSTAWANGRGDPQCRHLHGGGPGLAIQL